MTHPQSSTASAELLEYNPFSYEIHEDPYPTYARLRDERPVYHNEALGFFALSRWQDVWDATLDWRTFSSAQGITIEAERKGQPPMMILMDPPDHDRLRALVSTGFTPGRIEGMETEMRTLMSSYVERLQGQSEFDFVEAIANRLPMDVISAMLGVPKGTREELRDLGNRSGFREPNNPIPPPSAIEASKQMFRIYRSLIEERRERPENDLISGLLAAEIEREDGRTERLSTAEVHGFMSLLNFAGNETTAKMLSSAVYWLWRFPEQRQRLLHDPALIENAVEELLRFDTPSQYQGRCTTRDVELHGVKIPEGARVLLLTGAANRDQRVFDEPQRLDVGREIKTHLSFGYGHHFCLGKSLARMELRLALEAILSNWPDYSVVEADAERVHGGNVQRGFSKLPLRV